MKPLLIAHLSYLRELEIKAIKRFETRLPAGYNTSLGGELSPSLLPEVRAKISAKLTGIKRSAETRAKISIAAKTIAPSHRPEVAKKIANALKGRTFTQEHLAKISASLKALGDRHNQRSAESRARMSRFVIERGGIHLSPKAAAIKVESMRGDANIAKRPEVRAKISAAMKGMQNFLGKKHSLETRAKLSAIRREREENKRTARQTECEISIEPPSAE